MLPTLILAAMATQAPSPVAWPAFDPWRGLPPEAPSLDGSRPRLTLVGAAVRQRWNVDFYTTALYLDVPGLRGKLGDQDSGDPSALHRALAEGRIRMMFRTRFLYEASGEANLRFTLEGLKRYWPAGEMDLADPRLAPFLAHFGKPVRKGVVEAVGWDGKGALWLKSGSAQAWKITHPALAEAFARMYFADPPRDAKLRGELLGQVLEKLLALPRR